VTIKTGFGDQPGVPTIDHNTCTLCGLCTRVCKTDTLTLGQDQVNINHNTLLGCIGCGQCMMVCPSGSVTVTGRDVSPADLVDLASRAEMASPEALENLLLSRRSVREYTRRDLEKETIDKVLQIAATAPMGIPPSDVEVIVFHGREKVQAFAQDVVKGYEQFLKIAPVMTTAMRPFVGKAGYESFKSFIIPLGQCLVNERKQGRDYLFYDAPAVILFHCSPYADPTDCGIAATYAMIAAESLGLGSCMIGSVSPIVSRNKKLARKIGVPAGNKIGPIVLTLGYPDLSYSKAVRRRFASVTYL
jgi:ferredoxin